MKVSGEQRRELRTERERKIEKGGHIDDRLIIAIQRHQNLHIGL